MKKRIIKVKIPKVIYDTEMSVFNNKPILTTWMDSIIKTIKHVNKNR